MTSEDIARKANALLDTYVDKWKQTSNDNEEDWDTILNSENKQAKMLITANRIRIKDLKRRLAELQKKRERERQRHKPRRANSFADDEEEKEVGLQENSERKEAKTDTAEQKHTENIDNVINKSGSGVAEKETEVTARGITGAMRGSTVSV